MQIKTIQCIIDDDGKECRKGDLVLVQTRDMDEPVIASIDQVMTNMAIFVVDDRIMGHMPVKARITDIVSLTLHQAKRK